MGKPVGSIVDKAPARKVVFANGKERGKNPVPLGVSEHWFVLLTRRGRFRR